MAKYKPTMTRQDQRDFITEILAAEADPLDLGSADIARKWADRCESTSGKAGRGTWAWNLRKFAQFLETGVPVFEIISAKGNIKLPFYSWSTLPDFTCPGMGDCGKWCYSFRAWRYPAPMLRQLQNTILIRHNRKPIRESFRAIPHGTTLRLYVDGDLETSEQIAFWFGLLRQRPDIQAYGYSKSWKEFLALADQTNPATWPTNYVLNVSDGSRWDGDTATRERLLSLPIVRGGFHGVDVGKSGSDWVMKSDRRWGSRNYHNDVRQAGRLKLGTPRVFSCPGKCNECQPNGAHACGQLDFTTPIVIGIHG